MTVASVVDSYTAALAAEKAAALTSVANSWSLMTDDFDTSWMAVSPRIQAATLAAQASVARHAVDYVSAVTPLTVPQLGAPDYSPRLDAWMGVTGDGRTVAGLTNHAVIRAKQAVGNGLTSTEALQSAGIWLNLAIGTTLADTHRGVEQVAAQAVRVDTYARKLTPPSCGRCVILAGRFYKMKDAFLRHPGCDCVHIPAAQDRAMDLLTNPDVYLDSLSEKELAKALGSKANAKAWQDGADAFRLVNAYRPKRATKRSRKKQQEKPRLMPADIYRQSSSREEAISLLRIHGWIT